MARRLDMEAEYNARARVPEHPDIQARWHSGSAAYRDASGARAALDLPYGQHERQHYDVFSPEHAGDDAPLMVFIHGGYWQRGDRKDYSCLAEPYNARGIRVALPSYRICPEVRVVDIIDDLRAFLVTLYKQFGQAPLVVGHSAGGHLAAAMLATDWSTVDGVPDDLVTHAVSISGIFDLSPLVTVSVNQVLGITADTAEAARPLAWAAPPAGRHFVAVAGAGESEEFIRQSLEVAGQWGQDGVVTECVLVPSTNHFTVVDCAMRPGNGLFERIAELAFSKAALSFVAPGDAVPERRGERDDAGGAGEAAGADAAE